MGFETALQETGIPESTNEFLEENGDFLDIVGDGDEGPNPVTPSTFQCGKRFSQFENRIAGDSDGNKLVKT